jgi:hypothetical protein
LVLVIIDPFDTNIPDAIIAESKLGKLAKTGDVLKAIKTGSQLGDFIEGITIIYKDKKFVKSGLALSGLLDKGIIKIDNGVIKAAYPALFRYALEKGDYPIMVLIGKGTSVGVLEMAVKSGADLSKIRFITQNAKTIAWLEEGAAGAGGWGWLHISEGIGDASHVNQIAKALQINTAEVQGVIKATIESYDRAKLVGNSWEFLKTYSVAGKQKTIKVVVSTSNIGRIVTAFPA